MEKDWNSQQWAAWEGGHVPPTADKDLKGESTSKEKEWDTMKARLMKNKAAPASPVVRKFHAPETPETEVRRRVDAVSKLDNLRRQWEEGVAKAASTREEAICTWTE